MIFYNDRSYQLNIECKQNFVIYFWGGTKYLEGEAVKISYDILTPGQVGIAFGSAKIKAF